MFNYCLCILQLCTLGLVTESMNLSLHICKMEMLFLTSLDCVESSKIMVARHLGKNVKDYFHYCP